MSDATTVITTSEEQTRALGAFLGTQVRPGDVILLHGDLGAGKTTLTQGMLQTLGVGESVNSPTFILVAEHAGRLPSGDEILIRHADLYRITGEEQLDSFGYFDLIDDPEGLLIVEWPERAGAHLPGRFILVTLEFAGENTRRIILDDRSGRDQPIHLPS